MLFRCTTFDEVLVRQHSTNYYHPPPCAHASGPDPGVPQVPARQTCLWNSPHSRSCPITKIPRVTDYAAHEPTNTCKPRSTRRERRRWVNREVVVKTQTLTPYVKIIDRDRVPDGPPRRHGCERPLCRFSVLGSIAGRPVAGRGRAVCTILYLTTYYLVDFYFELLDCLCCLITN